MHIYTNNLRSTQQSKGNLTQTSSITTNKQQIRRPTATKTKKKAATPQKQINVIPRDTKQAKNRQKRGGLQTSPTLGGDRNHRAI